MNKYVEAKIDSEDRVQIAVCEMKLGQIVQWAGCLLRRIRGGWADLKDPANTWDIGEFKSDCKGALLPPGTVVKVTAK